MTYSWVLGISLAGLLSVVAIFMVGILLACRSLRSGTSASRRRPTERVADVRREPSPTPAPPRKRSAPVVLPKRKLPPPPAPPFRLEPLVLWNEQTLSPAKNARDGRAIFVERRCTVRYAKDMQEAHRAIARAYPWAKKIEIWPEHAQLGKGILLATASGECSTLCPKCGYVDARFAWFCPRCGAQIRGPYEEPTERIW